MLQLCVQRAGWHALGVWVIRNSFGRWPQCGIGRAAGGSSGWQAPEQLISRSGGDARQGRGTDVFSYGLLVHYCLSGGRHAFGESYERDFNILQARPPPGFPAPVRKGSRGARGSHAFAGACPHITLI